MEMPSGTTVSSAAGEASISGSLSAVTADAVSVASVERTIKVISPFCSVKERSPSFCQ